MSLQEEDQCLLSAALSLGEHLLECGGEINRVEDTIRRICHSYGAARTDVFAITSSIVVTMEREGRSCTQTRRINGGQADFVRLEQLNSLSRQICAEHPPIESLRGMVEELDGISGGSEWLRLAGFALASGAFTVFFGGTLADALCAVLCAGIIFLADRFIRPLSKSSLLHLLFCSLFTGALAVCLTRLGLCPNADKVMIGAIMLLIPGIALTNALRDLFMGDTISCLLRLLEALLQAVVIATGFAPAVYWGGMFL